MSATSGEYMNFAVVEKSKYHTYTVYCIRIYLYIEYTYKLYIVACIEHRGKW